MEFAITGWVRRNELGYFGKINGGLKMAALSILLGDSTLV